MSSEDTLKTYAGAPHGLTDMHKDHFNGDLLAFLKTCVVPVDLLIRPCSERAAAIMGINPSNLRARMHKFGIVRR